jgi:hypothetical protein
MGDHGIHFLANPENVNSQFKDNIFEEAEQEDISAAYA